ncbi:MAG: carbon storage regulator [Planctomycetota bacterium]|nr:MAG: carbon storage regulator [Planctomycetota bacterium]
MLVLSRRADEAIVIGNNIVVRVLGVEKNGQVRLGIEAPRSLRILRHELLQTVGDVNRGALARSGLDLDLLQPMVEQQPQRQQDPSSQS